MYIVGLCKSWGRATYCKPYNQWHWVYIWAMRVYRVLYYTYYKILQYTISNIPALQYSNIQIYLWVQYALWEMSHEVINSNSKNKEVLGSWADNRLPDLGQPRRQWSTKCLHTVGFSCTLHGWPWVAGWGKARPLVRRSPIPDSSCWVVLGRQGEGITPPLVDTVPTKR